MYPQKKISLLISSLAAKNHTPSPHKPKSQPPARDWELAHLCQPRLQTYNWSLCKIAHLRSEDEVAERPNLGRKPGALPHPPTVDYQLKPKSEVNKPTKMADDATGSLSIPVEDTAEPAKIQTESNYEVRSTRSTRNKNPVYVD